MSNCAFVYPFYSDVSPTYGPSLSGGSWPVLPLANLQDRRLELVARSASAALKDTRFQLFMGAQRRCGVVAIPKHTMSQNAQVRVMGMNSDQFYLLYESGEDIAVRGGTFTRATVATYMDKSGILRTAAAGELRDAHFVGGNRCTLLEATASTNSALWSEDLSGNGGGTYTFSGLTLGLNNGTAPDNTVSADSIQETNTGLAAEHYIEQSHSGITNGTVSTFSVYARSFNVRNKVRLSFVQKDNVTVIGALFDLTGAGSASGASAGISTDIEFITVNGVGYYRCSITGAAGTGANPVRTRAQTADASGSIVYVGTAGAGVYLWGWQMEVGMPYQSSYIKTTTTAVARNNDVLTFPITGVLSPSGASFSIYFKGVNLSTRNPGTYFWQLGTANPILQLGGDNNVGNYITSRFTNSVGTLFDGAGGAGAPHMRDTFEVVSTLTSAGAASTIASEYSLNGAASTTGGPSAAFTAPAAWGGTLVLTLAPGGANGAAVAFQSLRCTGTTTMAVERSLVYDSGWLDVWPQVFPVGSIPTDDPRYATGKYSAEDANYVNIGFTHVLPTSQLWTQVGVQISDAGNAAGSVDLARLVVGNIYQPTLNLVYGAKLNVLTATSATEMDGGARRYNVKPRRREQVFTIEDLGTDEALVNVFDMQRILGTSGQLFFIFDTADTYHMHRRAMLCTMRELSALEYPYFNANHTPFLLSEEL